MIYVICDICDMKESLSMYTDDIAFIKYLKDIPNLDMLYITHTRFTNCTV